MYCQGSILHSKVPQNKKLSMCWLYTCACNIQIRSWCCTETCNCYVESRKWFCTLPEETNMWKWGCEVADMSPWSIIKSSARRIHAQNQGHVLQCSLYATSVCHWRFFRQDASSWPTSLAEQGLCCRRQRECCICSQTVWWNTYGKIVSKVLASEKIISPSFSRLKFKHLVSKAVLYAQSCTVFLVSCVHNVDTTTLHTGTSNNTRIMYST